MKTRILARPSYNFEWEIFIPDFYTFFRSKIAKPIFIPFLVAKKGIKKGVNYYTGYSHTATVLHRRAHRYTKPHAFHTKPNLVTCSWRIVFRTDIWPEMSEVECVSTPGCNLHRPIPHQLRSPTILGQHSACDVIFNTSWTPYCGWVMLRRMWQENNDGKYKRSSPLCPLTSLCYTARCDTIQLVEVVTSSVSSETISTACRNCQSVTALVVLSLTFVEIMLTQ